MVSLLKGDQARTYATLLARRAWCWKRRVFQIRVGEDTAASHCLFSKNLSISCQHCVMLLGQNLSFQGNSFCLKGCPWNEWTSFAAARAGNLGVIKYLRENGCPFHKRNYQVAHNPAVQRYISENGYSDYLQLCLGRSSDDSKPNNVSFDYYEYY